MKQETATTAIAGESNGSVIVRHIGSDVETGAEKQETIIMDCYDNGDRGRLELPITLQEWWSVAFARALASSNVQALDNGDTEGDRAHS